MQDRPDRQEFDSLESAASARWPASRAAGLARLAEFAPASGGRYATARNYDFGPDRRDNVSMLSPYIRRRLITEREVVRAAIDAHGAKKASKFVEEVFWRGYFKGWLERRPQVWRAYREGLAADRARFAEDPSLADRVEAAEAGDTGIEAFDMWARELVEANYLHNHARMWFASIWIFTLGLPWRLGADFFLRHLVDGDPASNTLSWRWVGGIHTRGKNYAARAGNIARYTDGRLGVAPGKLDQDPPPLPDDEVAGEAGPVPPVEPPEAGLETGLLITEDDLFVESLGLDLGGFKSAATLQTTARRSEAAVSEEVRAFDAAALQDAALRAEAEGAPRAERLVEVGACDIALWARRAGVKQIVTAYAPVGWTRELIDEARPILAREGVRLATVRRPWDDAVWPHAKSGYFDVKKRIPQILRDVG